MKSIIGGRLYDTETAALVAEFYNSHCDMFYDLNRLNGSLYKKNNGEWFFCGKSPVCREIAYGFGTTLCCDWEGELEDEEVILLFEPSDAKEWLATHNFVDEYIKYFGKPEE